MPRFLYSEPRYWYHVSSTLVKPLVILRPWTNEDGFNRTDSEPNTPRICVAPTIEQCLVAIPYRSVGDYTIYRTKAPKRAARPRKVYDASVTQEGWLQETTAFIKIGTFPMEEFSDACGDNFKGERATVGVVARSRDLLEWWRHMEIQKYIKPA
jgi:hypothetical protein